MEWENMEFKKILPILWTVFGPHIDETLYKNIKFKDYGLEKLITPSSMR